MLERVPIANSEHQAARKELERVLASPGFARNERLARFLRFVVERYLEGRNDEIKESVLAVEVFGRSPDYDPRQDSIVRTEASRLRTRLSEYYLGGGKDDPIVIELPKGGYVPVLRQVAVLDPSDPAPETAPPARRIPLAAGIAGVLFASATLAWWGLQRWNASISIAVLPLINLSQEPNSDYFADGLTGEIIRNFSLIDGLVVRSQTSSFAFKGKPQNVREAGKRLNADYILEGSVLRAGGQLRINAQLVRVRDDFPLWSGRYDRELTDVFAIQDEISRGIVNSLRLKLGRGRRRYETSTEAYDLYLRGRAFEISSLASGRNRSVALYEQAVAKDTSFAPAYAALAAAYAYRTGEDRVDWVGPDRSEEITRMRAVVAKALQLDPLLAEAHAALGMVQARDSQWQQAENSFRHALELEPNRALTRTDFASSVLLPLGRIDEAVAQDRLAEKNDPLSPAVQTALAYTLFSAGRIDEAATHCPKPCTRALMLRGRASEAIPILEARFKDNLTSPGTGELGYSYALAGRRQDAERIAAVQPRPIAQAEVFVALGDKDRAFEALYRAIPLGPVRIGRALTFPEFAPLRGDPRVKILRKKVGLPE
jgi:serine/threonine-protein kinase